uniref:NAD(P)H oxidase (H2O2-forming) n=1 Tax=Panagrolaimus sp. PS1159 TaxID=55785 RepID=A0AC35FZC6_9BILA
MQRRRRRFDDKSKWIFITFILTFLINLTSALDRIHEFQRYDGWFNNLANPQWGSVGSRLHRDAPSNYQDGVYLLPTNLPSARVISDLVFKGQSGIPSQRNLTTMIAFFTFFSQVVAYEIMHSTQNSCPLEMLKIPVPKCDEVFDKECEGKTEIPFSRAKYDKTTGHGLNSPREQVNDRTSWIDGSFIYSTQEPWVAELRSWQNGTLAEGPMKGYPPLNNEHIPLNNPAPPQVHRLMNPERLFILGDSRVNENPGLLSFGLVLYRWHNIQAKRLQEIYPDWTDEELFQGARRFVVATLQKIVLYDFIPALLNNTNAVPPYERYKPFMPPGISHSFATTAFRFPHSIVPPALLLRKKKGNNTECEFRTEVGGFPALRLCQNWWNAQDVVQEYSVDEIVLGMASQIAEAEDNIVVEDLRDFIFGPMHFTRLDVVSTSIMRARDNGIPPYNELRKTFSLPPRNFETINPTFTANHPEVIANLSALYNNNIDILDAYVGGMLESNGDGPGELFTEIIRDQFLRLRDSDRFWFENKLNGIFTDEEIQYVFNITLRDIISQTTSISPSEIQENVFFWQEGDPCPQPFQVNTTGLESCVPFMRFDHFTAIEWLNETFCRSVTVTLDVSVPLIKISKRRGGTLRRLDMSQTHVVTITVTKKASRPVHGPFVCISIPKNYDVVLRLQSETHWLQLRTAIANCLAKHKKAFREIEAENDVLLEEAETKDKRQAKLDHFFREAYSKAFNAPDLSDNSKQFEDVPKFLEVLKRFTKGEPKEKLTLVFDMCDRNANGFVEKSEFCEFIKSLNMAVGVKIDQYTQEDVVESILHNAGIGAEQKSLSYKDFEAIFSEIIHPRRPFGVHFRKAQLKVNLEETASLNSFAVTTEQNNCFEANWMSLIFSYLETYHYRFETEHRDLRRVMGYGISITRGAAAAISFNMAIVLLTVCRNVMTILRETPLGEYIPFDAAITFHKIVAITAGFWATIHTVGHCINFYNVATQSQEGLACLFQEAVFSSNFLPSISYWFFGTITGITGILLVVVMSIIYVFAMPAILKRAYHAFRITHLLNILLYALTILHGLPKLLSAPTFWYYVTAPIIIFVLDRIIGMRQQYKQLQVTEAAILPSDIIYIQFKRPYFFKFRSGQWVRVSCPAFSCTFNEHHAFSLASAPQSPVLELYIKAVGPWTWKLRNEIIESQSSCLPYPVINLNGPFGDGNQEWTNYEVVVMVGGGIGVTPYASTLSDLANEVSAENHSNIRCRKVYFLWICPTHKNFEWFVEVLKKVEQADTRNIIETHIFVTQFFHKFDLRTTMLYICEKHFRGLTNSNNRSMFTGLKAQNHFGRPNFDVFFKYLQNKHQSINDIGINDIGVFSCGPAAVNKQIRKACTEANRVRNAPSFVHRFETF